MSNNLRLKHIEALMKEGFCLIPLEEQQKRPIPTNWQTRKHSDNDIGEFDGNDRNVGVLLGRASGGIVDVDIDHPIARSLASDFLPPTGKACLSP